MILKSSVRLVDLTPQLLLALAIANDIYKRHGKELAVTSIDDSIHGSGSLHPSGNAADLRTYYFTADEIPQILSELKQALTIDFDVIFENDHFHVEYDPK